MLRLSLRLFDSSPTFADHGVVNQGVTIEMRLCSPTPPIEPRQLGVFPSFATTSLNKQASARKA